MQMMSNEQVLSQLQQQKDYSEHPDYYRDDPADDEDFIIDDDYADPEYGKKPVGYDGRIWIYNDKGARCGQIPGAV